MSRSPFTEREVMIMINGTLKQLVRDNKYFYNSSIGPDYCKLTNDGVDTLNKQMSLLLGHLSHAIRNDDEERSKQMVFEQLKKETV